MKAAEEQTGETIPDLHPDPPPREMMHVWAMFAELHATRGSSGFGPLPIAYAELDAWSRLNGRPLSPWEVRALKAVDSAYLIHAAQAAGKTPPKDNSRT